MLELGLVEALRTQQEQQQPKCVVCELPNVAEINAAYEEGRSTGNWTVAHIARELRKHGMTLADSTLRRHFREHLKGDGHAGQ